MKTAADVTQAWLVSYGIAFAVGAIAGELRGVRQSPEDIDTRARELADRAMQTVAEKLGVGPPTK